MIDTTESEMRNSAFEELLDDEYDRPQTCLVPPAA